MKTPDRYLEFHSKAEWSSWLERNHAIEKEAWLRIKKSRAADPGISYEEAVEEALCYGWIDGVMKSLNEQSYVLRFSPRKTGSIWSASNRRRAERLVVECRMTKAGMAKILEAKESGEWEEAIRRDDITRVPEDLLIALDGSPEARCSFEKSPASHKKQYLYWINSAKSSETRRKRIEKTVIALEKGKPPWI